MCLQLDEHFNRTSNLAHSTMFDLFLRFLSFNCSASCSVVGKTLSVVSGKSRVNVPLIKAKAANSICGAYS